MLLHSAHSRENTNLLVLYNIRRPDPYVYPDSPTSTSFPVQNENQAANGSTATTHLNANGRAPLAPLTSPPEADATIVNSWDDEDLPRKRRVPNTDPSTTAQASGSHSTLGPSLSIPPSGSGASTLVESPYFGAVSLPEVGRSTESSNAPSNSLTQQFGHGYLSPARGDEPIIIDDNDENDFTPVMNQNRNHHLVQTEPSGSTGRGLKIGPGSGPRLQEASSDYGDFGDDVDIDDAFFAELDQVEAQATSLSQQGSQNRTQPGVTQTQTHTPIPTLSQLQSQSRSQSSTQSNSTASSSWTFGASRAQEDVITIDDEDEEDKENRPVMVRRVRRRRDVDTGGDVIDISD